MPIARLKEKGNEKQRPSLSRMSHNAGTSVSKNSDKPSGRLPNYGLFSKYPND